MRNQRGFTLIEIMTVLAIIGALVAAALNVDARAYGANTHAASDNVMSTLSIARSRAAATRRIHRVQVQPNQLSIFQATTTGLVAPTAWQLVQVTKVPTGVVVWNAKNSVQITPGATPVQDSALLYSIDFRPDGQATASTVFLTDTNKHSSYRVLVYHATGGSYARESW